MKKFIMSLCIVLFIAIAPHPLTHAEEDYGSLFISVGDAIMKVKANDWTNAQQLIEQLNDDWNEVTVSNSDEAKKVDTAINQLNEAASKKDADATLSALTTVSKQLVAFENEQNPVDLQQQRATFTENVTPELNELEMAIASKDETKIQEGYDVLLAKWNRNEKIVREQSIAYYGKIETELGFLRIALSQDEKDFEKINSVYQNLKTAITDFSAGKELVATKSSATVDTLIQTIDKANQAIDRGDSAEAVTQLEKFLSVWPTVEGDVRTKNGGLYTKLENEIPVLAGKLSSENADLDRIQKDLVSFEKSLILLQDKTSYTVWDSALIMLREGLEALLVVAALLAFLRKANAVSQQKWIWIGAAVGVVMSIGVALVINSVFSAAAAGANREIFEGIIGVVAVVMMIGVGMWLHQKSNMHIWNNYIRKQMGKALSTGSIVSMAMVSFLSIFREGAETIIFYAGMAPSISASKLITGIVIAIAILAIVTFVFIRFSAQLPIQPMFKVATFLIYFIAFKILGVSIHALQLTNVMSTTQVDALPIVDWAGFYPTLETIIPQIFLILIITGTAVWVERKNKKLKMQVA